MNTPQIVDFSRFSRRFEARSAGKTPVSAEKREIFAPSRLHVERRAAGEPAKVIGYAAVFDSWSEEMGIMDRFVERIRPGAFGRSLREGADVRALVNHNPDLILGRNKSGTLTLAEDETGLRFELTPPDSPMGQNYIAAVDRGDLSGCSFRFYTVIDAWDYSGTPYKRDLIDVDIDDISIVAYPAYTDTSAALRAIAAHREALNQPVLTPRRNRAERLLKLAESY